jgi:CRP-like cAMP-binding protein
VSGFDAMALRSNPSTLVQRELAKTELLSPIAPSELARLSAASTMHFAHRGQILARAGATSSSVIFLIDGAVSLTQQGSNRRRKLLLGYLEGPSLIGDAEAATGVPWSATVRAQNPCRWIAIPRGAWFSALNATPSLVRALYRDACARQLRAMQGARLLAIEDVETRLIRFLVDHAKSLRSNRPLIQTEIASALGVNRITVSRALKKLEERGILRRTSGRGVWELIRLESLESGLPGDIYGLTVRTANPLRPLCQEPPSKLTE